MVTPICQVSFLTTPPCYFSFQTIAIKSIHRKRMAVREVKGGQTASFALKKIKRSQIRKGMVMVHADLNPQACWEFEGEILVLHHPTTISSRYQAMVHCGSIRQTASILTMDKDCLRTGDKAQVRFRFIKHPEYIRPGQRMVFREGRTKAVGNVLRPLNTASTIQSKAKPTKMQARGQQNQNPNVQVSFGVLISKRAFVKLVGFLFQTTSAAAPIGNETRATLDSVLEIGTDKRNYKPNNRGGKRKRGE
jgi:selenocysteine-specific translation elongation factor